MKILLLTTAAVGALFAASSAYAQTTQPAAEPATATTAVDTPQDDRGIADIVVTAQRREESAQRAAVAIDVISPSVLQNAGVVTTTQLNAAVPSLFIARGGGANTSLFIRGVGNFTNNGYSDPAVAFNVDGVYYGRPTSTTGTFYDLDRVEVLKGPQGTLYGRNATGGAINIIPAKPVPGELSGYASGGYGRFDTYDVEGAINLPLGEHGAVRVSGKAIHGNGYDYDGTNDEVGQAFRVQMLGELTPDLTVRVSGDYSHSGGVGTGYTFNGREQYTPGTPATATSPANYTYIPTGFDPRSGLFSPEAKSYFAGLYLAGPGINPGPLDSPFQNDTYVGTNAEITWKTDVGTLTVIPAFRDSKVDFVFNGPAFRAGLNREHDDQGTLEARFAGKRIGPIDWLIGGFYYNETIRGLYNFNQYTIQAYQNFHTATQSTAFFGRLTAHLTSKFRLVGGIRYTEDRKQFAGTQDTLVEICTRPGPPAGTGCVGGPSVPTAITLAGLTSVIPASQIPAGLPPAPGAANARPFGSNGNLLFYTENIVNSTLATNRVTFRAAAEYDVLANSLLYASYETGYRSGGFALTLGHESYGPEYIKASTIGLKNRFFDNRVQLNIEGYYWKYSNQQVAHFGLDTNGNSGFFSENIGKSTIKGVDVDAEFKVMRTTLLRGSVQYLDNTLDSFVYTTPRGGTNLPPVVGCPYSNGLDALGRLIYSVDCSGRQGFNSPKWATNAGFDQTFEFGDYKAIFTADARYRSNRVIGFEYLTQENSGSQVTIDASLRVGPANDQWAVTGWVRNLTNKEVPVLAQYAGTTGGTVTTAYGPPRTYGVRARVKF